MKRTITTNLLALIFSFSLNAATYTTTAVVGTWDIGGSPGATDDIVVNHDWSSSGQASITSYSGTMTINSGGYYKMIGNFSTTTAAIDVQSGGTFHATLAITLDAAGTTNVDGLMKSGTTLTNNDDITGSGTLEYATLVNNGTIDGAVTLPVELVRFYVENIEDRNVLIWETASEINNDYFEVQKSFDGENFETIDIVNGNGNSSTLLTYSAIDNNVDKGIVLYYRLKQNDYNGNFEFSNVVSVGAIMSGVEISQSSSIGDFRIVSNADSKNKIVAYDISGKLLMSQEITFSKGQIYNFSIENSSNLFVTVIGEDGSVSSEKFVMVK